MPEGNIGDRETASGDRRPGVEGPFACTIMSTRQPVRSAEFLASHETPLTDGPSMPDKPHTQGRQTTLRKSDDRIVPLKREDQSRGSKPGNAGAGKASKPVRVATTTLSGHSAGLRAILWHARSGHRARRCWWGAGCVNGARPVLGGARGQLDTDQIL